MAGPPREGAYVHGLYIEGARWDTQTGMIAESRLKELSPSIPVMFIKVGVFIIFTRILISRVTCIALLTLFPLPPKSTLHRHISIAISTLPYLYRHISIPLQAIPVDRVDTRNMYECPVYKTKLRGPTYVWTFNIKSKEKAAKWIMGGVALLLQI